MIRTLGRSPGGPPRVVIADDSALIYSDDYRLSWPKAFEAIGCKTTVIDISPLRRNLASGRGPYRAVGMRGMPKMLAQEVIKSKPDLVWCHHGRAASADGFIDTLRRYGVKVAVYLCDEPYEIGETARYSPVFDYVFTMDPATIEVHIGSRDKPGGVFYLPPAADADHFAVKGYEGRPVSALFLGNASLTPRPGWLKPVERMVDGCEIRYWPSRVAVAKGSPKWVPYEQHPKLYASCQVGLNVHRDPGITMSCWQKRVNGRSRHALVPKGLKLAERKPARDGTGFWNDGDLPAAHVNPRFFEMAACGTLVVSDDHRTELARMFPFAPRAGSPEKFLELVMHYLSHLDEAEEIGRACSKRISERHTWNHRAAEVLHRAGLMELLPKDPASFLGQPQVWLTPQDWQPRGSRSFLDPIGRSGSWSPQYGMSLISGSGDPSLADSIDSIGPLSS